MYSIIKINKKILIIVCKFAVPTKKNMNQKKLILNTVILISLALVLFLKVTWQEGGTVLEITSDIFIVILLLSFGDNLLETFFKFMVFIMSAVSRLIKQ
jgi:hypothetical protein